MIPRWQAHIEVGMVTPNVGGALDADLRMRGWVINTEHTPIRPGDWAVATATIATERRLVEEADHGSTTAAEFEEALCSAEDEAFEEDWHPLDLGVAGLVMALNAAGFATTTSCRAHADGYPFADYPFVIATGDAERIAEIRRLVARSGAGISEGAPGEGFGLYAQTVLGLMDLAALVVECHETFDALPESIPWDDDLYEME